MRWFEVISEEQDFQDQLKNSILDTIVPLRSQGISSLTLKQLMDQLKTDPDIMGMDITSDYLSDIINKIPGFSVHTNSDGVLVVDMEKAQDGDEAPSKQDASDKKVDNAAMRQATKDL